MGKPSSEFLPWSAPCVPFFFIQQETVFFLRLKELVEFASGTTVNDDGIGFIIPTQTTGIQIGASYRTHLAVDHNNLRMVKSWFVHPYVASFLHQAMCIVETTIGGEGNIAGNRKQDIYFNTSFYCFP